MDIRPCRALNLVTNEAAIRAQTILNEALPDVRAKRHRKRRHVLLMWCLPSEWEKANEMIQAGLVMTALSPRSSTLGALYCADCGTRLSDNWQALRRPCPNCGS